VVERAGIITQGKSIDELVLMLRDAIELMWNERDVALELVLSSDVARVAKRAIGSLKTPCCVMGSTTTFADAII
jgi:hypothetical protein